MVTVLAEPKRHFQHVFDPTVKTTVRVLSEMPSRHRPALHVINLQEEKERFLKFGKTPRFRLTGSVESFCKKKKAVIRFDFLPEARCILERVRDQFGSGDCFLDAAFGSRLTPSQASQRMVQYLKAHGLDGCLSIIWANDLNCTGKMVWHGPNVRLNRPEDRKYTLWLKKSSENVYLREHGIQGLADHEIGTHFLRMINDGLQPWYSNRPKFGLRSPKSLLGVVCEEGLAAVHTIFQAQVKMLFLPALLYYTACMSTQMTFKELFEHLAIYICDAEQRWKQVVRVKRLLADCDEYGGCGKDQCYLEGAIQVLRQVNDIDFKLLYAGKICVDEVQRIRRIARQDFVKLPHFLKNISAYKRTLNEIALMNGLVQKIKRPLSSRAAPRTKRKKKNSGMRAQNRGQTRALSSTVSSRTVPHPPLRPMLSRRSSSSSRTFCISASSFTPS